MSYQYATTEETLPSYFPKVEPDNTEQTTLITALLVAASSAIDRYTDRPAGYFSPTPAIDVDHPKTTRRYRGRGENFLRVGRYVAGTAEVAGMTAGTDFYEQSNGWLFAKDPAAEANGLSYGDGPGCRPQRLFGRDAVYLVSARWGFAETPPDIKTACQLIAQHVYDRGQGTFGQVTPQGFVIERDIPPTVRLILDNWKRKELELN